MKDTEGAARVQDREKVMEWIKTNKVSTEHLSATFK